MERSGARARGGHEGAIVGEQLLGQALRARPGLGLVALGMTRRLPAREGLELAGLLDHVAHGVGPARIRGALEHDGHHRGHAGVALAPRLGVAREREARAAVVEAIAGGVRWRALGQVGAGQEHAEPEGDGLRSRGHAAWPEATSNPEAAVTIEEQLGDLRGEVAALVDVMTALLAMHADPDRVRDATEFVARGTRALISEHTPEGPYREQLLKAHRQLLDRLVGFHAP